MSDKRPSSTKLRRELWDRYKYKHPITGRTVTDCHICGQPIDPAAGDLWDDEHVVRRALTGSDDISERKPAHRRCHVEKSKIDNSETAKGKRTADHHYGIKRSKSPLMGSRNHPSGLRRRMSGKVERW